MRLLGKAVPAVLASLFLAFAANGVSAQAFCVTCDVTAALRESSKLKLRLTFDPRLIREIAVKHPRFAATLAGLNNGGGLTDAYSKIFWTPVEITQNDVEWWLKPGQQSAEFFKALSEKARSINQNGAPPTIYELTLEQLPDPSLATFRLRVVNGNAVDPSYSLLEVDLVNGKAKGWRIN